MIDRGLRLIWWSDTYWPSIGGIEVLGEQLLRRLVQRGIDVVVVTSCHADVAAAVESRDGVEVHRFPFHEALTTRKSDLWGSIASDVRALEERFNPDVIHVNLPAPSTIFHMLTAKSSRARTVASIQTEFPQSATGSTSLTSRMLLESAWTTANSRAMLNAALAIAPGIVDRSSVIYNGLLEPATESSPLNFDPPVIACVARLVHKKGIDIALHAFAVIRKARPRARLIVAGDGPELETLCGLASELGLAEAVEFRGWVAPTAIAKIMNEASQVWVPSRRTEPFGNVTVEAMQMGRPVIVTDLGGLPEVVEDGVSGVVIPPEDPAALAEASLALFNDVARARLMGAAGKKRAYEMFSLERYASDYENLYRHLAADHQ